MPADTLGTPDSEPESPQSENDSSRLDRSRDLFAKTSVALLLLTFVIVIFGAFVRASLSGDGCGTSWPICNGEIIPVGAEMKTYIEATHRYTTASLGIFMIGMLIWSVRLFPTGHPARHAARWALTFTIISGIIGWILIRYKYVVFDKSMGRLITMPLHLINTFGLMGACALMAHYAWGGHRMGFKGQGTVGTALKWAAGGFFVIGMTGAISAMGKTAFHTKLASANTFLERINMHVGDSAEPILKGGVLHPLVAMAVGLLVIFACRLTMDRRESPEVRYWGSMTVWLYVVQMVFGVANLVASAPVWMQLTHLAIALANWMALVMLAVWAMPRSLAVEEQTAPASKPEATPGEMIKAYIALTKPRVISLLLFTTVAAMFIAERGMPSIWLILIVCIGGYMSAGAANTYNMIVEKDLDEAMERTSHRPTVTHLISDRAATIYASVLAVGSFAILWFGAHPLAAVMALCGLLCYVFVYTLWLKRRTWHNIVIGGAAGAFPPLVGFAAVSGELNAYAWFLFALIFTWTPVHFWALAILIKDDYAKAGVPMLPVVKGDRVTVIQIGLYAVITVILCLLPLVQGQAGPVYVIGAGLLNLGLLVQCAGLWKRIDKQHARGVFKYSMVYLALIFIVIAVDRVWTV